MRIVAFFIVLFSATSLWAMLPGHHPVHGKLIVSNKPSALAQKAHKQSVSKVLDNTNIPQPYDSSHNKFYRSYVKQGDITHVDSFTGNMTIHLPLIDVPTNDGIALKVTMSFNNRLALPLNEIARVPDREAANQAGYGWYFLSGSYDPNTINGLNKQTQFYHREPPYPPRPTPPPNPGDALFSFYSPVFVDPDGVTHAFYEVTESCSLAGPGCTVSLVDKNNWHETVFYNNDDRNNPVVKYAVITTPNGTTYTLHRSRSGYMLLSTITSPNHGSTITYNYTDDDVPLLTNITLSTTGSAYNYTVNFDYQSIPTYEGNVSVIKDIHTSDGRRWNFGVSNFTIFNDGTTVPTLASITQPNGSVWSFTANSEGMWPCVANEGTCAGPNSIGVTKIVSPTGLTTSLNYQNNYAQMGYDGDAFLNMYDCLATPFVIKKTLSGVGKPAATWLYQHEKMSADGDGVYRYNPTTIIVGPDSKTVDTFNVDQVTYQILALYLGPVFTPMTGVMTSQAIYNTAGALLKNTSYVWAQRAIAPGFMPTQFDPQDLVNFGFPYSRYKHGMFVPELQSKTIDYGGTNYTTAYSNFDAYGYPGTITSSSPQASFVKTLTYYEDTTKNIYKVQNETTTDTTGAVGNTITRAFDANGNMINETDNGVGTTFAYDGAGNLTSKTDAAGNVSTYANYIAGLPGVVTDPMGNKTTYAVQPSGIITSITDPMGKTIQYNYGALYRLTGITPAINAATSLTWTDNANGTTMVMTRGGQVTTLQLNSMGKPLSTVSTGGTSSSAFYNTYDPLDRLASKSFAVAAGTASPPGVSYTYDALDRVLTATEAGGYATAYAYNDATNTKTTTDPAGNITVQKFRSFGDPSQKLLIEIDQPEGVNTVIARDLTGHVTAITQGNYTRSYGYDGHHFLISQADPELGTTSYVRDAVGNLISKAEGSNGTTTYGYDKDYHLISTNYQDSGAQSIVRTYDPKGRLINITNSTNKSVWAYSYDANNNMLSQTLNIAGKTLPFSYAYDSLDHITSASYPDGTKLNYTVNPAGQITAIAPYLSAITYFPDNHISSFQDGNGITTAYTENQRNMRNSIVVAKANQVFVNRFYQYNEVGNIFTITDKLNSKNNQAMAYDGINRLTDSQGSWGEEKLAYDVNSNILTKTIGTSVSTYVYDDHSNLLTSITGTNPQSFKYLNGDATVMSNVTLTYNQLHQVDTMHGMNVGHVPVNNIYSYDGNGNRVVDNENTNLNYEAYNQSAQLLYKNNPGKNSEDFYVHIGNQSAVHLHKEAGGALTPEYLHNNILGSTLMGTDASATTKWQQQYKPYGSELMPNTGRTNTHLGYTGKPHDNVTGLSYYGARYYSPGIGRFLSMDPAPVDASNPMSFNRYAYANDNPYRYTDPTGKVAKAEAGASVSATGGLGGTTASKSSTPDSSANNDDDEKKGATIGTLVVVGIVTEGVGDLAVASAEAIADASADMNAAEEGASASTENSINKESTGYKGSRGNELKNRGSAARNQRTTINGKEYTGHALDQMQNRGITPSVVEDALSRGVKTDGYDGATQHTTEQSRVITNPDGSIKTVYHR